jgi:hypothetical protein
VIPSYISISLGHALSLRSERAGFDLRVKGNAERLEEYRPGYSQDTTQSPFHIKTQEKAIFGFGNTWVQTQGLILARQVFYHLSHTPAHFALIIFQVGSHVFAWDWP